jgi:peptidoglycan-N-acetylglucosamine deacetylase
MTAAPASTGITNALSFDIEDWFHLVGIDSLADPATWDALPSIVVEHTEWILQTLAEFNTRATFFMLGWTAEKHPQLASMIAAAGHDLAVHSYWHRRVDTLTPEEFREDIKRTIDLLQQQAQAPVRGFRAPSFSIKPGTEWAFDVLLDLGITWDSSLVPAPRGHGGYPCRPEPHLFEQTPSGRPMRELPISVMPVGPRQLAFSGGGYMRLLPLSVIRRGFASCHKRGLPVVVYLHPRDFAADCPRAPMPPHRRFKSYVGLSTTRGKLRALLAEYRFDTCEAVLAQAGIDSASQFQGAAS